MAGTHAKLLIIMQRMQGAIHQSIEWLDKLGMAAIEQARMDQLKAVSLGIRTRWVLPEHRVCDNRGALTHLQTTCGNMATPSAAATRSASF